MQNILLKQFSRSYSELMLSLFSSFRGERFERMGTPATDVLIYHPIGQDASLWKLSSNPVANNRIPNPLECII